MRNIKNYESFFNSLNESTGLHCGFFLANDGKWYMYHETWDDSGDEGSGMYEDYGPFNSFEEAIEYLNDNFANPGAFGVDKSGRSNPPKNPNRPGRSSWGYSSRGFRRW
jgi:hypothetical protein